MAGIFIGIHLSVPLTFLTQFTWDADLLEDSTSVRGNRHPIRVQLIHSYAQYKNNNCRTVFFENEEKAPTKTYAAKPLEQTESEAAHRAAETPEQSQARRRRHAEYLASQRAVETPEQSQARHLQHATYMASQKDTETIEAAESRKRAVAERAQQRRLIFTKNTCVKLSPNLRAVMATSLRPQIVGCLSVPVYNDRCAFNLSWLKVLTLLFQQGKRQREIVRLLNVPRQTVSDAICRFKDLGNDGQRPGSGRKRTVNAARKRVRGFP
ncbi:hypothetical protein TNCV_129861 [Trichonephila clavipes]|nr:hypothetical protein TNCV_129861 [Trichonephila clavipes]